jgi:hypothetical protein
MTYTSASGPTILLETARKPPHGDRNMNTLVRLWTHGETTDVSQMEDAGYDERLYAADHSIVLEADRCDELYSQWAASDFMGSFYDYAKDSGPEGPVDPNGHLTDQDRLIRIRNKLRGLDTAQLDRQANHNDAEIMGVLAEMNEEHGGHTDADDLNRVEVESFVFWQAQCDPDYGFCPAIIS